MLRGNIKDKDRKNIIIICAHLAYERTKKRTPDFMQPMAGLHIAAQIDAREYNVELYHEMFSGPYDTKALKDKHYDILFLTGLQKDFDRMRQLSYYFQKAGTLVVAGGSICTLFPDFAKQFFNVVGVGGVESVKAILMDYRRGSLKSVYHSPIYEVSDYILDYGLLEKSKICIPGHLIESSRGCNFRCDFCTLPPENAKHSNYKKSTVIRNIKRSIDSAPLSSFRRWYPLIWFIDNNFSQSKVRLMEMCYYLKHERRVRGWGCLITQDALHDRGLISLMSESKCYAVFVGLESLDIGFLLNHNKKQNFTQVIDDIDFAQRKGIVVIYGYLFDPRQSSVDDMTIQLRTLIDSPILNFPSFISYVSPLVGTEFFWNCVSNNELLPNLRLRDLEGSTLSLKPAGDLNQHSKFLTKIFCDPHSIVKRNEILRKTIRHLAKYRYKSMLSWLLVHHNNCRHIYYRCRNSGEASGHRNFIGGLDILDPQYSEYPENISSHDKDRYFKPIVVTNDKGKIADWLIQYAPQKVADEF